MSADETPDPPATGFEIPAGLGELFVATLVKQFFAAPVTGVMTNRAADGSTYVVPQYGANPMGTIAALIYQQHGPAILEALWEQTGADTIAEKMADQVYRELARPEERGLFRHRDLSPQAEGVRKRAAEILAQRMADDTWALMHPTIVGGTGDEDEAPGQREITGGA